MKVQFVNDVTPRSDNRPGKPGGITLFNTYEVVEIEGDKYTVLNDENKLSRYSQNRFIVVDPAKPKPLRQQFNTLTSPMRQEIKRLRKLVADQNNDGYAISKILTKS